jgi:hypothetical protein
MKFLISLAATLAACAVPVAAQTVTSCDRWEARAENIAEPWEQMTRTFSNGAVRLVVMDAVEPAVGPLHLLILSPPYSELGERQCRMISVSGAGFAGIGFADLTAAYDPQTGLGFDVPVSVYDGEAADFRPVRLGITLNQATGAISAKTYAVD